MKLPEDPYLHDAVKVAVVGGCLWLVIVALWLLTFLIEWLA